MVASAKAKKNKGIPENTEQIIVDIDTLVPHPRNYHQHPAKQIAKIKSSLLRFGQRKPIVIQYGPEHSIIVAGHGTTMAARELIAEGHEQFRKLLACPTPADWTEDDIIGFMTADNLTGYDAEDDETLLAEILEEQRNSGFDLASLGSSDAELDALLERLGNEALEDGSEIDSSDDEFDVDPEGIEIRCKRGELWKLGNHYLLVDDCTKPENVRRLMQGKKAHLVVTSPPYSDQREYGLGSFNWHDLMCGSFDQMIANTTDDCHILINLGVSHKDRKVDMYWLKWLEYCASKQWPLYGWYIWDKLYPKPKNNDGRLVTSHEFLFHFNNKSHPCNKWIETDEKYQQNTRKHRLWSREKDGSLSDATSPDKFGQAFKVPNSVIPIGLEHSRGIHTENHPAVYPVALPEFIMQTWSQENDVIYEPFCGSGTTIVAGERLNRAVYACEIDIKYSSVILARWEAESGELAELIGEPINA